MLERFRRQGRHGVTEGEPARPRLEIWARIDRTLNGALRKYERGFGRVEAAEAKYGNRRREGASTPSWVSAPGGVLLTGGVFAIAVCGPVVGIDLTGTTSALMPSADQLGGETGVRAAAAFLGLVLAVGAVVTGVIGASAIHMRMRTGRVLAALGIAALVVGFTLGINKIGADRAHGLAAARVLTQADEVQSQQDDVDSQISKLRALLLRGRRTPAVTPQITTLQQQSAALGRKVGDLEQEAEDRITTNSLTWLQFAGFLVAAMAGVYLELGTMLRLEGAIMRHRRDVEQALRHARMVAKGLIALPYIRYGTGYGEMTAAELRGELESLIDELPDAPRWRTLAELAEEGDDAAPPEDDEDDDDDDDDDSRLKAV
jgi:hypothetical protein